MKGDELGAEALVVIPSYLRSPDDLNVTVQTLQSVRRTEPHVEIMVVDDCSPSEGLYDELRSTHLVPNTTYVRNEENSGFSKTVNRGLQVALDTGRDAVLLNADVDIMTKGWLRVFQEQEDSKGNPAHVVGALLLYPNGLIQSAGTFYSMLTRTWDHRYRFAPGALPEAAVTFSCPVTAAFQYIRHECLVEIGLYCEDFRMGFEDVYHDVMVFESGHECVYQPKVIAVHHESMFRGRANSKLSEWQNQSAQTLVEKLANIDLARYIPPIV